jgi:threonine dehydrogenase-like Zn-dependent dehydrogenase
MKALCWRGIRKVQVEEVPEPQILSPRDAILRITSTAICGSDLHLLDGWIPTMRSGDILGHEFMGEVVELGPDVKNLQLGDRVVVPFNISCGGCPFCQEKLFSLCDNSNPYGGMTEPIFGAPLGAIYGYSRLYGGYAGGQAEYVRVPYADVGAVKVPESVTDDQALFLSDILPTGYQAAEYCNLKGGETVAIWGCGPVGLFSIASAYLLGAKRVIAIDRVPERLALAAQAGAETIDYEEVDELEALKQMTGGRGPDCVIDAVGLEAHGTGLGAFYDKAKTMTMMATDRLTALRQAIMACRKGGTVSIPGVYGGFVDKFPLGIAFAKGLQLRMGQTNTRRYMEPLLERIQKEEIDPTFLITHRLPLEAAAEAYYTFRDKEDGCVKVVLKPNLRQVRPEQSYAATAVPSVH